MKAINSIDHLNLAGKKTLVRLDLNVPFKDKKILDTSRIERILPTITELIRKNAQVIVMSHFGRPKGKQVSDMSLRPVAKALSEILSMPVIMANDCVGELVKETIKSAPNGSLVLLENLRFHPGEEENKLSFASELADLGEIYINDAFSCAHRAHASVEKIARLLPAAAGRLMEAELEALSSALDNPNHPVAAIVGGAKVSTKLAVLGNLIEKVDQIIIGGAMANTFLVASGVNVGSSLCELNMTSEVK